MEASANTSCSARFDVRVHSLSAIKKAAYKFTHAFSVRFETVDQDHVIVRFLPLQAPTAPLDLLDAFHNEVLDQDLREHLAEETKGIRDLIIAQAFSPISLLHPELETEQGERAQAYRNTLENAPT